MSKSCTEYLREKLNDIMTTARVYETYTPFSTIIFRMLSDAINKYGEKQVEQSCDLIQLREYYDQLKKPISVYSSKRIHEDDVYNKLINKFKNYV